MDFNIVTGVTGERKIIVTADKTAVTYGSGTLEVYATPAMIALMEQTAMESVASFLSNDFVTVGTEVSVKHVKATLPGSTITCKTILIRSEGKKLIFEVTASDEAGLIGIGTHTRYIVGMQSFIDNLRNK